MDVELLYGPKFSRIQKRHRPVQGSRDMACSGSTLADSPINRRAFVCATGTAIAGAAIYRSVDVEANSVSDGESSSGSTMHDAVNRYRNVIEKCAVSLRATNRYRDERLRAQGEFSLIAAESMAYNMVANQRSDHLSPWHWNTNLAKVGQPSSDCVYTVILLDGRQRYRINCRKGDINVFLLQMYSHVLGHPLSKISGNYEYDQFQANIDGSVDIVLSADRVEGNWIKLDESSQFNFLFVRRFYSKHRSDKGYIGAKETEAYAACDEFTEASAADRYLQAAYILDYLVNQWTIGLYDLYVERAGGRNKLAYTSGETFPEVVGSPSTSYALGIFDCAPDEAIIIEHEVPDSSYWGYQLGDAWSLALDWMHHQTDINMDTAYVSSDGKFRAVIAHDDPGFQNWLDPCGLSEITIVGRNYLEVGTKISGPSVIKVRANEVRKYLPFDTPEYSKEKREKSLRLRRDGHQARFDG